MSDDVSADMTLMKSEDAAVKALPKITLSDMYKTRQLRIPLIIAVVIMLAQQFSGINAVSTTLGAVGCYVLHSGDFLLHGYFRKSWLERGQPEVRHDRDRRCQRADDHRVAVPCGSSRKKNSSFDRVWRNGYRYLALVSNSILCGTIIPLGAYISWIDFRTKTTSFLGFVSS